MLYIGAVLMYFIIPIEHSDLAAHASKIYLSDIMQLRREHA